MTHALKVVRAVMQNGRPLCAHCQQQSDVLQFPHPGHPRDVSYAFCACGEGESLSSIRDRSPQRWLWPAAHYEAQVAALADARASGCAEFYRELRLLTGLNFVPMALDALDGRPLKGGDVVLDKASQQPCIVLDNERAVRKGLVSLRAQWVNPDTPLRYLTVTRTEEGRPLFISWQDEDHRIQSIIWEASSATPKAEPEVPALKASDIAARLPVAEWQERASGVIHPRPQARIRLTLERNTSWRILDFEERDVEASERALGEEFLQAVGDELSPSNLAAFIRAFAEELSRWQHASQRTDDYTGDLLRSLLTAHQASSLKSNPV